MRELTGRHVFVIFALGFGTIIAVNVTLAVQAVGTFPGLETKNSYVASQKFEAERNAQSALGWTVSAKIEGEKLLLTFADAQGREVRPRRIDAIVGRPTYSSEDISVEFALASGVYSAEMPMGQGRWRLSVEAEAEDSTVFRQRIPLFQTGRK